MRPRPTAADGGSHMLVRRLEPLLRRHGMSEVSELFVDLDPQLGPPRAGELPGAPDAEMIGRLWADADISFARSCLQLELDPFRVDLVDPASRVGLSIAGDEHAIVGWLDCVSSFPAQPMPALRAPVLLRPGAGVPEFAQALREARQAERATRRQCDLCAAWVRPGWTTAFEASDIAPAGRDAESAVCAAAPDAGARRGLELDRIPARVRDRWEPDGQIRACMRCAERFLGMTFHDL